MKVRDLFIIFLKLLGVYIVVVNIEAVLAYIPVSIYGGDYGYMLFGIGGLLVIVALAYVLFKYGDALVKYILPEKGLEDTSIQFDSSNKKGLLEIGIILVSFSMIINNIQLLILQGFYFFKKEVESQGIYGILDSTQGLIYDKYSVGQAIISVVLGLLLIAFRKSIIKLF